MTRKTVPQTQFFHALLPGGYQPGGTQVPNKPVGMEAVASFTFTIDDDGAFSFVSNQEARIDSCYTSYKVQVVLDGDVIEEFSFEANYDVGPPYPPPQPPNKNLGIMTSHAVVSGTHTVELKYGIPIDHLPYPPVSPYTTCPDDMLVIGGVGFALLEVVTTATSS